MTIGDGLEQIGQALEMGHDAMEREKELDLKIEQVRELLDRIENNLSELPLIREGNPGVLIALESVFRAREILAGS